MVELLDLGKRYVNLGLAGFPALFEQFGKQVQRLRSEDHVNPGSTLKNVPALLARNAPAHGNHHPGTGLFDFTDPPQIGKGLFLGLFTNRAGHDNDEIGFFGSLNPAVAAPLAHEVNDAGRVIVVHLAAKAAQIDGFRVHGLDPLAKLIE